MTLSEHDKDVLRQAIEDYSFPPAYFNFLENSPSRSLKTADVEVRIKDDLTSGDPERVKNGLSNVLYWGYGQMGIRDVRVRRFREKVTESQLRSACRLFRLGSTPFLLDLKKLRLPEFSGMSFVSKIRMFLDPANSATLDRQIMKIREADCGTILSQFDLQPNQIPITARNAKAYEDWCQEMREISRRYFDNRFRAVDIERGLFQLVQSGRVAVAAQILKHPSPFPR